jgi:hypothetical protein
MNAEVVPRPHPPCPAHGDIAEIFPDIFFVQGEITMTKDVPFTMRFSRNMTILRQGNELTLVNSMRLSEEGLESLDKLGKVKHIFRLAAFHGSDDPFYKERYPDTTVWSIANTTYFPGFQRSSTPFFQSDKSMSETTSLPIKNASLIVIESSNQPEGLLKLSRDVGTILVSGDALQNWASPDRYFDCCSSVMMRAMGFIKPHNIGPGWIQNAKPAIAEVQSKLLIAYDHVLPAHGDPVVGQASSKYEPALRALQKKP